MQTGVGGIHHGYQPHYATEGPNQEANQPTINSLAQKWKIREKPLNCPEAAGLKDRGSRLAQRGSRQLDS